MTTVGKHTIWELLVALTLAVLIIVPSAVLGLIDDVQRLKVQNMGPQDFFIINDLTVSDAVVGQQPQVTYDRTIVRSFRGVWTAAVFALPDRDGVNYGVCNNSGTADYEPAAKLPSTVSLEWFIEKDCGLKPGKYVLRTIWEIGLDYNIRKFVRATSNVFEIFPAR